MRDVAVAEVVLQRAGVDAIFGVLETVHLLRGQIFPLPRSALRGRRGVTVRFTMVEEPRMALGFCMVKLGLGESTVRITLVLRKDVKDSDYPMR